MGVGVGFGSVFIVIELVIEFIKESILILTFLKGLEVF